MTAPADRLPFKLVWLADADAKPQALAVCERGHLVVNGRTHWAPAEFTADLQALMCEFVEHPDD